MRGALRRAFDAYLGVIQRAALPRLVDADHEQRRLNLLRLYVGLVALVRTALIVYAARFYFVDRTTGAWWRCTSPNRDQSGADTPGGLQAAGQHRVRARQHAPVRGAGCGTH